MDLCQEYQELLVSAGEITERAVVTSYDCRSAHIDSTGQSPAQPPTLVVDPGASLNLRLTVDRKPDEIELRLYPAAGLAASFMRWPEELPTGHVPIDQFRPEPDTEVSYTPRTQPGEYSLVARVAWGAEVNVFYAISFVSGEP